MTRLVDMVRGCTNAPVELDRFSDDEIVVALETELAGGYRIMDLLVDIGCEVAVEEICYLLGVWERPFDD